VPYFIVPDIYALNSIPVKQPRSLLFYLLTDDPFNQYQSLFLLLWVKYIICFSHSIYLPECWHISHNFGKPPRTFKFGFSLCYFFCGFTNSPSGRKDPELPNRLCFAPTVNSFRSHDWFWILIFSRGIVGLMSALTPCIWPSAHAGLNFHFRQRFYLKRGV